MCVILLQCLTHSVSLIVPDWSSSSSSLTFDVMRWRLLTYDFCCVCACVWCWHCGFEVATRRRDFVHGFIFCVCLLSCLHHICAPPLTWGSWTIEAGGCAWQNYSAVLPKCRWHSPLKSLPRSLTCWAKTEFCQKVRQVLFLNDKKREENPRYGCFEEVIRVQALSPHWFWLT